MSIEVKNNEYNIENKNEVILGLDDTINSNIILTSNDNSSFTIPKKYAMISNTIKTTLSSEDFKQEEDENDTVVLPLDLEGDILALIVEYMKMREGSELVILNMRDNVERKKEEFNFVRRKNFEKCKGGDSDIPKREADFIRTFYRNRRLLYGVCEAANYLHIESLLHICCAVIACIMKGKSPEELKVIMSRGYVVPENIDEEAN
jgi:S-phase kinase-associated protein 1